MLVDRRRARAVAKMPIEDTTMTFTLTKHQCGNPKRYGFIAHYCADYRLQLTKNEKRGRRLDIGAGKSLDDFKAFVGLSEALENELYLRIEMDYRANRFTQRLVNKNGQSIRHDDFTERLMSFIRTYYVRKFCDDKERYLRFYK